MKKPTILLVDNKPSFRAVVREFLEIQGYEVLEANDASTAQAMVASRKLALVVIDVRLTDDDDENDIGGLTLAKELPLSLPKIMLTAHPTYQAVREALGPALNGIPSAVGFVAKKEGLAKLLFTIQLVLAKFPPVLQHHLLKEFGVPAIWALREEIDTLGGRASIAHLHTAAAKTAEDLTVLRKTALQQAERQQQLSLRVRIFGVLLLAGTLVLLLSGKTEAGVASTGIALLSEFLRTYFSRLEKHAYQRADKLHEQLREAEQDQHLMLLCEALENQRDRDEYRKKVMDHILLRRSA